MDNMIRDCRHCHTLNITMRQVVLPGVVDPYKKTKQNTCTHKYKTDTSSTVKKYDALGDK